MDGKQGSGSPKPVCLCVCSEFTFQIREWLVC
jgi:hypothetical protein